MEEIINEIDLILDNGLLIFAIFSSSCICSLMLIVTNKHKSFLFWAIRWGIAVLILPQKYIANISGLSFPFESPIETPTPFVIITLSFLIFDLFTGTSRGKKLSKKFKPLPSLVPLEKAIEEEQVDGTDRQVTNEIIDNEHDILEELVGNLSPNKLDELQEGYGEKLSSIDEKMPLANQNFPEFGGTIDSAEQNQEYCGNCNEPVKNEWKACPLCGEFLEEYEINS